MDEEEEHDVNPEFHFEILKVERLQPADMDEDFFEKAFGEGEVSNEEEAREKIRENIKGFYRQQAEAILYRDMQEKILELNEVDLPDDFLKRFIVAENEETSMDEVEADYENISKNFQWTIIRNKLVEQYDVKVETEEIKDALRQQVAQYMGNYAGDESFLDSMVERLMQDQKQVNSAYENKLADKLFDALKDEFALEDKSIELEDFKKVIQSINEEAKAQQA
jgi:trigger factor